jgi:DNA-binding NtrC family response regulator
VDDPGARSLLVMASGVAFATPLPRDGRVSFGRGEECDVTVEDHRVSRLHLEFRSSAGVVGVVDLASLNGSFLGARRLSSNETVSVGLGDTVRIGSTAILLQDVPVTSSLVRVLGERAFSFRFAAMGRSLPSVTRLEVELEDVVDAAATWSDDDRGAGTSATLDAILEELLPERTLVAEISTGRRSIAVAGDVESAKVLRDAVAARLEKAGLAGKATLVAQSKDEPLRLAEPDSRSTHGLSQIVARVAAASIDVVVRGETGVGKEVVARKIHALSRRSAGPLVCINCAALADALVESELFGHERGAFTGATRDKIGLLESASGGFVFLDEVGEMPLGLQAKLLRVLEQREVLRVGSLRPRPIDVRFVSATNRDLEAEVTAGRFRQDLYFRLNGVTIAVPPLRERPQEIAPLARFFAEAAAAASGRAGGMRLEPDALAALERHKWPGNVRELKNVIHRAMLHADGGAIAAPHLMFDPVASEPAEPTGEGGDRLDRAHVLAILERCGGNQTRAARMLGVARGTLIKRLELYDVARPRRRD